MTILIADIAVCPVYGELLVSIIRPCFTFLSMVFVFDIFHLLWRFQHAWQQITIEKHNRHGLVQVSWAELIGLGSPPILQDNMILICPSNPRTIAGVNELVTAPIDPIILPSTADCLEAILPNYRLQEDRITLSRVILLRKHMHRAMSIRDITTTIQIIEDRKMNRYGDLQKHFQELCGLECGKVAVRRERKME